uniref:Uncharacterized protein n=1 Tax=Rhizophora mucronata TaxID=61149 RepID=A0A2P2NZJ1_RHIMU
MNTYCLHIYLAYGKVDLTNDLFQATLWGKIYFWKFYGNTVRNQCMAWYSSQGLGVASIPKNDLIPAREKILPTAVLVNWSTI